MLDELTRRFGERTADEWEEALLATPAAVAKCNTLEEWFAHEQAGGERRVRGVDDAVLGTLRLAAPPVRVRADAGPAGRVRRHGSEGGALGRSPRDRHVELLGRPARRAAARPSSAPTW